MKALTHVSAGMLTGIAFISCCSLDANSSVMVIAGSCIGSLLPDIDICTSKVGRIVQPASFLVQLIFGHRNMFHSPLPYTLFFFGYIYAFLQSSWPAPWLMNAIGLLFGSFSHLLLDMLNPAGIPLFWPFVLRRISLAPFKSGGIVDYCLCLILSCLTCYFSLQLIGLF